MNKKIFCEYKDVLGRILANELPTHNYISFEFSHDSTDKDVVKFVDRVSWMLDVADSLHVTLPLLSYKIENQYLQQLAKCNKAVESAKNIMIARVRNINWKSVEGAKIALIYKFYNIYNKI